MEGTLANYWFVEYDVRNDVIETFNPELTKDFYYGDSRGRRKEAERAASLFYSNVLGYEVSNIDHKEGNKIRHAIGTTEFYKKRDYDPILPEEFEVYLENFIKENTGIEIEANVFDIVNGNGVPDLLMCKSDNLDDFQFVEVKMPPEDFTEYQIPWITRFEFFPVKITYVFDDQNKKTRFLQNEIEAHRDALG